MEGINLGAVKDGASLVQANGGHVREVGVDTAGVLADVEGRVVGDHLSQDVQNRLSMG